LPEIKLTPIELRYISLLQDLTGVTVKDCIIDDENNRVIFIVSRGQAGIAIGRKGSNIVRLKKILGKDVEIVEEGASLEELAANSVAPARVRDVKVSELAGKKTVYINVFPEDKGIAIGKNGKNAQRAKLILKRYYDIDNVVIV
jgi:N utilization substance protein A